MINRSHWEFLAFITPRNWESGGGGEEIILRLTSLKAQGKLPTWTETSERGNSKRSEWICLPPTCSGHTVGLRFYNILDYFRLSLKKTTLMAPYESGFRKLARENTPLNYKKLGKILMAVVEEPLEPLEPMSHFRRSWLCDNRGKREKMRRRQGRAGDTMV